MGQRYHWMNELRAAVENYLKGISLDRRKRLEGNFILQSN